MKIALVVHNVRSAHNVGSILRTADGLGVEKVYLTGYTPYPKSKDDERMPHEAAGANRRIHKTALGAEASVKWEHRQNVEELIGQLKEQAYQIVALEQTKNASDLHKFKPNTNVALIVGSEVGGLDAPVLKLCDVHVQIPMAGAKESFNVAVAAGIALYQLQNLT